MADVGWVTGHTYIVYGPLANGVTTTVFESTPVYPTPSRYWQTVEKHKITQFYSAPTAIRLLRRLGHHHVEYHDLSSLRVLGSVGEPINPDVWQWYHDKVGLKRCPIIDTWWQTETGGILITPLPGATPLKPGSAAWPFFGILPAILAEDGQPVKGNKAGHLVIKQPWPGMMLTIYGDKARFHDNYFKQFPGYYLAGDSAYCDDDGYYWITGRDDDVIKVSGHRIGTGEVESALMNVAKVSEAAVVTTTSRRISARGSTTVAL